MRRKAVESERGRVRGTLHRAALAVLAVSSPLALAALLWRGPAGAAVLAFVTASLPVALMALGAAGRVPDRRLAWLFGALLAVLGAASLGVLALSGRGADGSGFPPAAIVQVVGLWLIPLPLAALGYALTFDRAGLRRDDLAALRRLAAARGSVPPEREAPAPPARS